MMNNTQLTPPKTYQGLSYLQLRKKWSFSNIGRTETNAYTHGYHRYPAKFIPQLVKELIHLYAPTGNEIICDPFGGCGTTLVEAKISGRKSIGFDINPIAKLITQVKITPINPKTLERYRNEFDEVYRQIKENKYKNIKHHSKIKYWFDTRTIKTLNRIYLVIKSIKNSKVKRFYLCAFSHNLKNSSRWLMKSTKPTIDKNKKIQNPHLSFLFHLDSMIRKNEEFYKRLSETNRIKISTLMYKRDSTKTLPLRSDSIDLIITSPPYVTSYEYADLHQLSLLWFGDDSNQFKKWNNYGEEMNDFKKKFVGTSFRKNKIISLNSTVGQRIVSKLSKLNKTLSSNVAHYFNDMEKALEEMYRILKPGGKACIIIGNTNLRGINILNAQVAVEQMSKLGFQKVDFIKREVSNKMITPWRDEKTGKFTSIDNPDKKRVYECEYVIIMRK